MALRATTPNEKAWRKPFSDSRFSYFQRSLRRINLLTTQLGKTICYPRLSRPCVLSSTLILNVYGLACSLHHRGILESRRGKIYAAQRRSTGVT